MRRRLHSITTLASRDRNVNREIVSFVRGSSIALSDSPHSCHASAAGCVSAATTINNHATTISAALPSSTISLSRSGLIRSSRRISVLGYWKPASGEHVGRLV